MLNEAIILAGGMGTRLRSLIKDVPKPLAVINEKPFLCYVLNFLMTNGISKYIFSLGYKADLIREYFGETYRSAKICYVIEDIPLGTGGAIKNAVLETKNKHVLVVNGDSLFKVNIQDLYQFHLQKKADVTFALKYMNTCEKYGTVSLNSEDRVLNFSEKKHKLGGIINGGVYVFNVESLKKVKLPKKFSIESEFFQKYVDKLKFYGFKSDKFFLDIGTPKDFMKAKDEFRRT